MYIKIEKHTTQALQYMINSMNSYLMPHFPFLVTGLIFLLILKKQKLFPSFLGQ